MVNLCVVSAHSQSNNLIVTAKDGSKNLYDLNTIKRIKFQSSNLEISSQNKIELISLTTIKRLTFGLYSSNFSVTDKLALYIYPNPAHDFLSIVGNSSDNTDVEIYSANGIRLMSISHCQSAVKIDISTLSKGLYIAKVNNNVVKFIKI